MNHILNTDRSHTLRLLMGQADRLLLNRLVLQDWASNV